jgi:hypothetical protein
MLHIGLIALHAVSGVVALGAGASLLRPPGRSLPTMFSVYLGALWAMVLFLAAAVGAGWPALDRSSRVLFGALTIFAVFIGARGWAARKNARQRGPGWEHRYLENVGFTLVALFDGFVIVAALDLGAPVWLIVLIGVLGVLIARLGIGRIKQQLAVSPPRGRVPAR